MLPARSLLLSKGCWRSSHKPDTLCSPHTFPSLSSSIPTALAVQKVMGPPAYLGNPSWTHNLASSWRPCQSYLSWEFWRKRKRASSPVYWDKQGSHNQQVSQMSKEIKMSISQQNTPIERKNTPECEHNRGAKLWKRHNRNTKHQQALRQIYRGEPITTVWKYSKDRA